MALGARIRLVRERLGIDQATLCLKVPGLSQQNLSNLETRDSKTSEYAIRIADALQVPVRWLLVPGPQRHAGVTQLSEQQLLTAFQQQLYSGFAAALPLRVEPKMKRNIMGAALAAMLGMSALSAPQAIKAGGEMPLIGPAKVSSGRPPRRSGRGVRAARRAALKARNVARNRRAHR